ncbi:AMP-dependent synthetase and ligase [Planctomycetales bacterium 10988]|nr:AMP-dependent synthetase and ligase [Planctomycetales bacterium 10988]
MPAADTKQPLETGQYGLWSYSYVGLMVAQFLGAMNDNVLRWLVVLLGKEMVGKENEAFALSMGLAGLVLPYLVFAAPAAYLSDRFSKRNVIVGCKAAEIAIMILAVFSIWAGSLYLLCFSLILMGTQSALYGPAKLGGLPEMLRVDRISSANGIMGLATVIAILAGTACGFLVYKGYREDALEWLPGVVLISLATCGWIGSLFIRPLPVANPEREFPWSFPKDTYKDLKMLGSNVGLRRAAFGSAFFWSMASLSQLNVDLYGTDVLGLEPQENYPLLIVLGLGTGFGSILAGWLSAGRIELGLTPLGTAGIVISSILLYTSATQTFYLACLSLFLLGTSAGLYEVPIAAFLQHRSPAKNRGSILAAVNFLTFGGMLIIAGLFYFLKGYLQLEPGTIFLLAGLVTIPVLIYIVVILPFATARFLAWCAAHTIYQVKVTGRENIPETGGALLVANHVSWIDGVMLILSSSRPIRMIAHADYISSRPVKWLCKLLGVIPINPAKGPKAILGTLRKARKAIEEGELVCIFAEGAITRTGQLQGFRPGFTRIIHNTNAPLIPVYLDELWGSIFSYRGGKFFWKWPKQWPYPVSIFFGPPVDDPEDIYQVRQAVQTLGVQAVQTRKKRAIVLPRLFIRKFRKFLFREKIVDSTGQKATGGTFLMRVIILKRLLEREILSKEEERVGVLLPPSLGAVTVNTALSIMRKVSVNLNYSASAQVLNYCSDKADLKHILTSRRFVEKLGMDLDGELVYLEDLKDKVTFFDKFVGFSLAYLSPAFLTERLLGLHKIDHDDPLTIIFTSGSTGNPKGVVLTYHNIGANIQGFDQMVELTSDDLVLGILPFFHSFGYTATMWSVLTLDIRGLYHFSPLDAKLIGKLAEKYKPTILLATPTFLRNYLRRCTAEQFESLSLVIVGAEKLHEDLADAFEEKFGKRPYEGYGATELSPLVAVNLPDIRSKNGYVQISNKEGTVGRPFHNLAIKIVHPETFEPLKSKESGMMLISGPSVMKGYLNAPELTAEKMYDGSWYITGDLAQIDDDGFIKITGRQSRFSKIGGEMVPHVVLEEKINAILESGEDILAVVTAVPDEKRGERIVVLHLPTEITPNDIRAALKKDDIPNLWIPSSDSFLLIEEIPMLGSGKIALGEARRIAKERFQQPITESESS